MADSMDLQGENGSMAVLEPDIASEKALPNLFKMFDTFFENSVRIQGRQTWIILCGYAIGETALFCAFADAFVKAHGHGIVLVITTKHIQVANMYAHSFLKTVVISDDLMRAILRSGYIPQDRFEVNKPLSACWIDQGFRMSDGIKYLPGIYPGRGGLSETDFSRFLLRLPWSSRLDKPRIAPEWEDQAWQLAKQVGLRSGRSVVLCPINNSTVKFPLLFWEAMARRLNELGYIVFTNVGGLTVTNGLSTMPIPGTTAVDLPINLVVPFVNFAGRVVSGPNGMFFLMMLAGYESFKMSQVLPISKDVKKGDSSLGCRAPDRIKGDELICGFQYAAPERCLGAPLNEFLIPHDESAEELMRLAGVVADENSDDPSCIKRYECNGKLYIEEHAAWLKKLV